MNLRYFYQILDNSSRAKKIQSRIYRVLSIFMKFHYFSSAPFDEIPVKMVVPILDLP
jgi:hypothetical protein